MPSGCVGRKRSSDWGGIDCAPARAAARPRARISFRSSTRGSRSAASCDGRSLVWPCSRRSDRAAGGGGVPIEHAASPAYLSCTSSRLAAPRDVRFRRLHDSHSARQRDAALAAVVGADRPRRRAHHRVLSRLDRSRRRAASDWARAPAARVVLPGVGALAAYLLIRHALPDARGSGIVRTKSALYVSTAISRSRAVPASSPRARCRSARARRSGPKIRRC